MRTLRDVEQVKAEVRRIVARRRRRDTGEFEPQPEDVEVLLDSVSEFLPVWTALPCVFRTARIQTNGTTVPYSDNVALPAAKHDLPLLVEMLNHIRKAKGLDEVKMPLFLQPDEIAFALAHPAECHCDEEREVLARARSIQRLGRRASKRWLYTGQDVLDRDGRKCTRCGATKDLHVHWTGGDGRWTDAAGYVTLCRRCHVVEGDRVSPGAAALRFHLEGTDVPGSAIRSQLALVFEKGSLRWVGLALGREYVVLDA
jgi:5-methylcytosine-specific restriction endonuclease McrA